MHSVRVQYQVKEEFVEQNLANISAVMNDLRENPIEGMLYCTFYLGDGQFMHLNSSKDPETTKLLGERSSFQAFRSALKESGPVQPPQSVDLEYVGSNRDLF